MRNEALKRGRLCDAVRLYRPLAAKGDPSAQVNLGFMYDEGLDVPQDYAETVKINGGCTVFTES